MIEQSIPQQFLQLLLALLAERNHRLLLIVELQGIAIARKLNDGFDVLEVHQVSAMRLEEAAPGEARFQFLQGQVSSGLLAGSAQVGLPLAAGGIEYVAGVKQHDAIFFASGNLEGGEAF